MSGAFGFNSEKTRASSPDQTPGEFQGLRGDLADALRGLLGSQSSPLAGLPSSPQSQSGYSAPIAPGEQAALGQVQAAAGDPARQKLLQDTLGGQYTEAGNPFTQAAIEAAQRPTKQALEDTLSRTLPGQFAGAGHSVQPGGSSPFDVAAARAYEGGANALANIATNISFGAHEAERGRQQEAIAFSQGEVDTTIKNLQAQALPRLIEQYGIDQGLAEFQKKTDQLMQLLQLLAGVTAPTLGQKSKGDAFGFKTSGGAIGAPDVA